MVVVVQPHQFLYNEVLRAFTMWAGLYAATLVFFNRYKNRYGN